MSRITTGRIATFLLLVAVWCALWGDLSAANVLSGAVVAGLVLVLVPPSGPSRRVRIVPLVKFFGLVLVDLVRSTGVIAWEVMTPRNRIDEAIIAVGVPSSARAHLLLLSVAVTLTPGTAVVDADPVAGTLYLHVLHADQRGPSADHVRRLAELACAALPVEEQSPEQRPAEEASS